MDINQDWQPNRETIWQAERDRFIVLLHFYNGLDFAEAGCLCPANVMRDLALTSPETDDLVASLLDVRFLRHSRNSPGIMITPSGIDYIEIGRGRRQSLRLLDASGPICPVTD